MNQLSVMNAISNWSLTEVEDLQSYLPRLLHFLKLEKSIQNSEMEEAELAVKTFGLNERSVLRNPIGALNLVEQFFSENEEGTKQAIFTYCKGKNADLKLSQITSAGNVLFKKGKILRAQGCWKKV